MMIIKTKNPQTGYDCRISFHSKKFNFETSEYLFLSNFCEGCNGFIPACADYVPGFSLESDIQ